jgi:hypothetical protein
MYGDIEKDIWRCYLTLLKRDMGATFIILNGLVMSHPHLSGMGVPTPSYEMSLG